MVRSLPLLEVFSVDSVRKGCRQSRGKISMMLDYEPITEEANALGREHFCPLPRP
jgi:hypothetical protein